MSLIFERQTTATILWPLYRRTCISWYPQL